MDVIIQSNNGETFLINGAEYVKGSVTVVDTKYGEYFTLVRDGSPMFENIHWSAFKNGDDSDNPFASITALQKFFDTVFPVFYPQHHPYHVVSAAGENAVTVKEGRTLLHAMTVVNTSEATRYVKVYDMADTPGAADTPVLVFRIPVQAEDLPFNLMPGTLILYYGLGIRIADEAEEEGEFTVAEGDILLNLIYQ